MDSDPYAVLGVARDAGGAQIVRARRRLLRAYHPDVNHDPGAGTRFEEVQRAFDLLSDPAARAEYDRTHDKQGQALVMRAADGDYGLGGDASAGILIQPASVDFGVLTPQRPWADAKVTIAWTGQWPGDITRSAGNDWWRVRDSTRPASSCVVFHLRAAAHCGGPRGRRHDQFTVTVNDTVLTAGLSAEFRGDFSAVSKPNFDLALPPSGSARQEDLGLTPVLLFCAFGLVLISGILAIHAGWIPGILASVAWLLILGTINWRYLRHRNSGARDEDRGA